MIWFVSGENRTALCEPPTFANYLTNLLNNGRCPNQQDNDSTARRVDQIFDSPNEQRLTVV